MDFECHAYAELDYHFELLVAPEMFKDKTVRKQQPMLQKRTLAPQYAKLRKKTSVKKLHLSFMNLFF